MSRQPRRTAFVVRVWLEEGPEGTPVWRGYLREVRSQEGAYFQSLQELAHLLEERTGVAFPVRRFASGEEETPHRRTV